MIKPLVPWGLRNRVRRYFHQRARAKHWHTWPILETAAAKPASWPGWPDEKKFAIVLTHDVEGSLGVSKTRRLAELEQRHGFRSLFNFIPEGEYPDPVDQRTWLKSQGFEVGVHDLHHDGKLFSSLAGFEKRAKKINKHLEQWGASGFRAGFMLRNLDWYHQLNIRYDASTFDTDPFEPMPDGVDTIFPFWIPFNKADDHGVAPPQARDGYVELPYTMPQDSTLFLVMKETSPEIWIKKLDWVASHGGMVLMNVHPDYMRFGENEDSDRTYPVDFYAQVLEHVRSKYTGQYWNPLPIEMAEFVERLAHRPVRRKPKRVCMVTHSHYSADIRVMRYAEALAERGDHVDVLSLRRQPEEPIHEIHGNIQVHKIQNRFSKNEGGMSGYILPLLSFFLRSTIWMTRAHWKERYDFVHIHNIPDFLVFSAWYPKFTGTPVLLDVHDIVPEFFANKFSKAPNSALPRMLLLMERMSAAFADHVIIANHLWLDMYSQRTNTVGRCTPYINYVDADIFTPATEARTDGKQIIIFPGGLQWHQGVDIAIRAFALIAERLPRAEFHIYGDGGFKDSLVKLVEELGLGSRVLFFKPLKVREVSRIMATANLGVVPKRADSFGNEAYSTKIMEFMALGVPLIISSTKIDRYYFGQTKVPFFESGNHVKLAEQMVRVLEDAELRKELIADGLAYAAKNTWQAKKADYLQLADSLG